MGIFDMFKKDAGSRAYHKHSQANRMNDMGKLAEAEAMYREAMTLYLEAEAKRLAAERRSERRVAIGTRLLGEKGYEMVKSILRGK